MIYDTAILGAGIAGSAAAIRLARAGQSVLLLDREQAATHKVCGEFLSGPATSHLRSLGLDPAALGAQSIQGLRLISGARTVETALPFEAWGLSRFTLDSALRTRAAEIGAQLRLGVTVRRLTGVQVTTADGEIVTAQRIILATGKHDLADRRRMALMKRAMVGFKLHIDLTPEQLHALGDRIELHLFDGGYAGLQPVGNGITNFSLVSDEALFAAAGHSFSGLLAAIAPGAPILAGRLAGYRPLWPKPLAVSRIPYGFRLWRMPDGPDWLWPVGDQAAVIPSFTGDGMAMAMASAEAAAATILSGGTPALYRRRLRSGTARQLAVAEILDHLVTMPRLRSFALAAIGALPGLAMLAANWTRVR